MRDLWHGGAGGEGVDGWPQLHGVLRETMRTWEEDESECL